jgi:hypothetical protein
MHRRGGYLLPHGAGFKIPWTNRHKKPEKKTYWSDFSQWFDEMQECKTLK